MPKPTKKKHYTFSRPYGIPLRYHDFHALTDNINLDFVEFHLSYHDLEIDLAQVFHKQQPMGFTVHCPELLAGDHLLDLASPDAGYRERSRRELQKVIAVTCHLQRFFPAEEKPLVVVNAGGWSFHGFLPVPARKAMYQRVAEVLAPFDDQPVTIAIQTMPPFPWHFGGQSHHNLFVDPVEITDFCQQTGIGLCLDISHSMMACNYYQWPFDDFLQTVLPYTRHLHLADARGIDGEGIQIGTGDVDFERLTVLLRRLAPGTSFIPEIWQGHKNNGEGFWAALAFLEEAGF